MGEGSGDKPRSPSRLSEDFSGALPKTADGLRKPPETIPMYAPFPMAEPAPGLLDRTIYTIKDRSIRPPEAQVCIEIGHILHNSLFHILLCEIAFHQVNSMGQSVALLAEGDQIHLLISAALAPLLNVMDLEPAGVSAYGALVSIPAIYRLSDVV